MENLPSLNAINKTIETTNDTIPVAITKYIARGTDLQSYSTIMIQNGFHNVDPLTNDTFNRLMSYMIENGRGSLLYYVRLFASYLYTDLANESDNKETVLEVALITDPVLIVILLLMFIPFILKVQSTMERIYLHICKFNEADIKKWLDACNNSAADLKASITSMQEIYRNEVFEINLADYDKKAKKKEEKENQADTLQKQAENSQKANNDQKNDGEEESKTLVEQAMEITLSERKQKTFSQMSKEKTKTYLFYLIILVLYIGGFKIADGLLLQNLESEANKILATLSLFNRRIWDKTTAMLYFRENMVACKVLSDYDRIDYNYWNLI